MGRISGECCDTLGKSLAPLPFLRPSSPENSASLLNAPTGQSAGRQTKLCGGHV